MAVDKEPEQTNNAQGIGGTTPPNSEALKKEVAEVLSSMNTASPEKMAEASAAAELEADGAEGLHEKVLEVDSELGTNLGKVPIPEAPVTHKLGMAPITAAPQSATVPPPPKTTPDTSDDSIASRAMLTKMPGLPEPAPRPKRPSLEQLQRTPTVGQKTAPAQSVTHANTTPLATTQTAAPNASMAAKKPGVPAPLFGAAKNQPRVPILDQLKSLASSPLHPLRTYQGDAEDTVRTRGASLISVLAAEEDRKTKSASMHASPTPVPARRSPVSLRNMIFALAALILLASGVAALVYTFFIPTKEIPVEGLQGPRLIDTDERVGLRMTKMDHSQLLRELTLLRDETKLSLGLTREIYFVTQDTDLSQPRLATAQEVLPLLAPHMPPEMQRSLLPSFIVGVHVFDDNQGFIILQTDGFEQTASAMYEWEPTMRTDLLPFLDRRPRPRTAEEAAQATSSPPRVVKSDFTDAIVQNRDVRALYDNYGEIVLLYSFINRYTVVITTNDRTLLEVVTRLHASQLGFDAAAPIR